MAENKKSFILYADQKGLFDKLPDEIAGKLIKHIFKYITDENPQTDDLLLEIAFEPIKMSLKRDLVEWNEIKVSRSLSGRIGGLKSGEIRRKQNEAKRSTASKNEANEAVSVNDSVSVSVNVNDINIKKEIFNQYPISTENYQLTETQTGSIIEFFKITKQTKISSDQVIGLWTVFKTQNLTGEKFYEREDKIYSHFLNWTKTQKIENGTAKSTNGLGKKSGGFGILAESLKQSFDRGS